MALSMAGRTLIALAGLHAIPGLAQSVPSSAPPDVIVEGVIPDDQKRVCKQTTATGSIFLVRTCKTKAEWEKIRERSIAQMEQWVRDQEQERFTRLCNEYCGQD